MISIIGTCPVRSEEFGLARQARLSRPTSARSFSTPKPNLVLIVSFVVSWLNRENEPVPVLVVSWLNRENEPVPVLVVS